MNPLFLGLLIAGGCPGHRRAGLQLDAGTAGRGGDRRGVTRRGAGREGVEPTLRRGDAEATGWRRVSPSSSGARRGRRGGPDEEPALDEPLPRPLAVAHAAREGIAPDPDIECVVLLHTSAPAPRAALERSLLQAPGEAGALARPARPRPVLAGDRRERRALAGDRGVSAAGGPVGRGQRAATSRPFCARSPTPRRRSRPTARCLTQRRGRARGRARPLLRRPRRADRAHDSQG